MQPGDPPREIGVAEGERPHDHGLGAGGPEQRHGRVADAAVGGEPHRRLAPRLAQQFPDGIEGEGRRSATILDP